MSAPPPAPAVPAAATQDAADKGDKTAAAAASDHPFAWPNPANNVASVPAPATDGQAQPSSTDSAADDLPPPDPIAGWIPLPRHRPNVFAMVATAAVPLPRARPAVAPEAPAPTANDASFTPRSPVFRRP
jgi:hypothetical protein